jgi:hypothetical protein
MKRTDFQCLCLTPSFVGTIWGSSALRFAQFRLKWTLFPSPEPLFGQIDPGQIHPLLAPKLNGSTLADLFESLEGDRLLVKIETAASRVPGGRNGRRPSSRERRDGEIMPLKLSHGRPAR